MFSKSIVIQIFQDMLDEKKLRLQTTLADLKHSASNETKSTAGDKHETALAMLQLEQENKRNEINIINALITEFHLFKESPPCFKVIKGSLIKTNYNYLYLNGALGKIYVDEKEVIGISHQSPMGTKLLGLGVGDQFEINGKMVKVEEIQ
jgi:hypothetical protein